MINKITRRQIIAISAASAASAVISTAATIYSWWRIAPTENYTSLNKTEASFINALAGAAYPPGQACGLDGSEAGLDRFFDQILTKMEGTNRNQIKLLVNLVDTMPMATHLQRYTTLPLHVRTEVLHAWLNSEQHLIRNAVLSLVTIIGMGYTSHPEASKILAQYHNCGFGA